MARSLEQLWRLYADTGPADDAPTYRAIAHSVADNPELLAVAAAAPEATHHPNHLLAAVRYLLLSGTPHPLAAAYEQGDIAASVPLFGEFVLEHRGPVLELLQTRRIQTNEVGRVAVIAPALAHVRAAAGAPLGLLDVGTSAGLNLLVDRCRLDYGTFQTGPAESTLKLRCALDAPPPVFDSAALDIVWRMGLDRAPIALDDEDAARWLLSCVWVDQLDRIERLATAIELARTEPSPIATGDAVQDLAAALEQVPPHTHAVVTTTWVMFYLDPGQRRAFESVLAAAKRPVSWVSIEHPGVVALPSPPPPPDEQVVSSAIGLVDFDGRGSAAARQFLGWAHPHGKRLDWHAASPGVAQGTSAT